jgi:hypothetical protein
MELSWGPLNGLSFGFVRSSLECILVLRRKQLIDPHQFQTARIGIN